MLCSHVDPSITPAVRFTPAIEIHDAGIIIRDDIIEAIGPRLGNGPAVGAPGNSRYGQDGVSWIH